MKALLITISLLGLSVSAHAAQDMSQIIEQLAKAPQAADVEDDGGFEYPVYIEGEFADGAAQFWDAVLTPVGEFDGLRAVCNVSTERCEESRRYGSIDIYVDRNGNQQGQTMTFVADGRTLFSSPVSTGVSGHRSTPGSFQLKYTNAGRLHSTRNHCSSVKKYGTKADGVVYLAPMPYAVHYNGGEALHAGRVTGKPESHGCVRQPKEIARKTYCILQSQKNWSRTTVHVY